ncbi:MULTISPECIES: carboxymuconolactone decarboxylase family protein [Bacillus]|uniref:Gamma-carboxymuconolactone decarboxylase n=2 Tax=Bacillus TaxID=1386 RepID=A0A0M5JCP2_9BACI|nr:MULTISPECIES: carboxymuconolactone decarboxylase family protein [Bacillus]ALC83857.1 gamma-carboxymuconolactone decarboxylase [Bacillus gobiensis]MBP1083104.1 4-carboxymuconolactone decarboxylase [Bacillus capparidis]MED1097945.1 carboxymuconolactone decarboxylase family protein [Bacillus capparidis]
MERSELGWKSIQKLAGEKGILAMEELLKTSPRLGKLALEFGYGDIYSDQTLDFKQRAIITLSSLITQGDAGRGLHYHFRAALKVGWTKEEIMEVISHCAAYCGFPKALSAVFIFQSIIEEQEIN